MTQAKCKIKKGDEVIILTGKDKGKKGEVTKVMPTESRVIVAGINQAKKHRKATQMGPGGIDTVDMPLHISNVALADPKTGKATRVGYTTLKDGKKVRVAKASGETIG